MSKLLKDKNGDQEQMILGRLGSTFGLEGHLRFISYSGETDHIRKLREVALFGKSFKSGPGKVYISSVINTGNGVAIQFEGYSTKEIARELTGMELYAPRSMACPLKKNEFYINDLEGSKLVLNGNDIGLVVSILDGGGGQLLNCRIDDGRECLIPFRKEFIGNINIQDKTVVLLNGWILDIDKEPAT